MNTSAPPTTQVASSLQPFLYFNRKTQRLLNTYLVLGGLVLLWTGTVQPLTDPLLNYYLLFPLLTGALCAGAISSVVWQRLGSQSRSLALAQAALLIALLGISTYLWPLYIFTSWHMLVRLAIPGLIVGLIASLALKQGSLWNRLAWLGALIGLISIVLHYLLSFGMVALYWLADAGFPL